MQSTGTAESLRLLLEQSVDYAGLFPPAGLSMRDAVRNYASYRSSRHAWMLGRFVVPAVSLDDFAKAADELDTAGPWELAVLLGENPAVEAEQARERENRRRPQIRLISMEAKVRIPGAIESLAAAISPVFRSYFELPAGDDPAPFAAAAAAAGVGVKLRTGGVTPDAFPAAADVARFLRAALERSVPFKLTAGLHHPLRGEYRLTYQPGAACGPMFGFLNMFLAAAFVLEGASDHEVTTLLNENDAGALTFDDSGAAWRTRSIGGDTIRATRRLFHAFGSCSFTEPIDELTAAGLLA